MDENEFSFERSKGEIHDTTSKENEGQNSGNTVTMVTRGLGAPKCVITRRNREKLFSRP